MIAAVSGEAMNKSRVRLALLLVAERAIQRLGQLDRTDHVSPCPQSAGAAMQVRSAQLLGRVLDGTSEHD